MSVELKDMNKMEAAQQKLVRTAMFHLNSAQDSMVTLARELAPVDTGFMRDHILPIGEATSDNLKAVVESQAEYSIFVEYGTVNMDAQPFFTPAFESASKQLKNVRGIF